MPTAWTTVWTCLEELVGMLPGCNVLVQAATGGVGLVAVAYAQQTGAPMYATAGRVEKQAFVQGLGVPLVSTTRDSTIFVAEMGSLMGSSGQLGLVLNSLTHGEYVREEAQLLCKGGRFMEIGKRGIWSRSQMSAVEQARYSVVAMDSQCSLDPAWQHAALQSLNRRVAAASQEVRPLTLHVFEFRSANVEAFRLLHRARQIGKVVVSLEDRNTSCTRGYGHRCTGPSGTGGLSLLV